MVCFSPAVCEAGVQSEETGHPVGQSVNTAPDSCHRAASSTGGNEQEQKSRRMSNIEMEVLFGDQW